MKQQLNFKTVNTIPQDWHFAKLDLFDNATDEESILDKQKLKLSISFRHKVTNELVSIKAVLNSPKRHYKRNIDAKAIMLNGVPCQHYKLCLELFDNICAELGSELQTISISKLYESRELYPGKFSPKTIESASTIMYKTADTYYVMMILENNVFQFCLDDDVQPGSRKRGVIATNTKRNDFVPKAMTPLSRITSG